MPRLPSRRSLLRSAVLVAWAAVTAVMVYRSQAVRGPADAERRPLPADSAEQWQGIYREGAKIGYAHRVRTPTADGFSIVTDTRMRLAMLGETQVVETRLDADTDRTLELRRFDFRLRSGSIDFKLAGKAEGRTLELVSDSLGERAIRLPLSSPLVLSETLQDVLGQEHLATGKTFRYTLLDPVSGEPAEVVLEVGDLQRGDLPLGTDAAYLVTEAFRGSRFRLWVAPDGEVVKEEGPLGLVLVRELGARTATSGLDTGPALDLASVAAIPVARSIAEPRSLSRLSLRVTGLPPPADGADFRLSFPPRQTFSAGRVTIAREASSDIRSFELPARDPALAVDLAPTPFLQSGDPEVRDQARAIVKDDRDAERAARRLVDWVFRNLAKAPTISVPNARDVLRDRRGDCNEHAVLYAALARAAGLPARVAAGTVYMPGDRGAPGAFYYHAWDEVWLGDWVAVDPTFGQFPADATHLKLVEGGPEKHVALVALIGKLGLEVDTP